MIEAITNLKEKDIYRVWNEEDKNYWDLINWQINQIDELSKRVQILETRN